MLYRFKALAKRRDPDQLDVPLALASPRGWVVTLVIGFCMLALLGISWASSSARHRHRSPAIPGWFGDDAIRCPWNREEVDRTRCYARPR